MKAATEKISVVEKIGYSLGDLAANLIFQTLMAFIAFFYTDIYKIPPVTASAIIFGGGMFGAFFNPVMGIIADRTNTRWGKFRPWILWTSIPFGLSAILAFATPSFSPTGKIIYALGTYVFLVLMYSANNLPYSSLSGVMTGNMQQRNSISAYRFTAAMTAQFIIQVLLLPLALIFGDGDKTVGFGKVMTMFAIVGIVFFIITFLTTKERIVPKAEQEATVKQDLSDLSKNRPWLMMLGVIVFLFITVSLKGGMYVYYFEDFVNRERLGMFLENVGFNGFIEGLNSAFVKLGLHGFQWPEDIATSGFSLFNALATICMIIGIMFSKRLADRIGKREVFKWGIIISASFQLSFFFCGPNAVGAIFLVQILHGLFYGLTIPMLWAMIADVADYSEWKNNRRATAIIFSAMIFGLKVGLSVGGALVAGILGWFGYAEQAAIQSAMTVMGIKLSMSVFPTITFAISVAFLLFYTIDKKMEVQIERELEKRRLNNEEPNVQPIPIKADLQEGNPILAEVEI